MRARKAALPDREDATPAEVAPDELRALVAGIVQVTLDTRWPGFDSARRASLTQELEQRLLVVLGPRFGTLGSEAPPAPSGIETGLDDLDPAGESIALEEADGDEGAPRALASPAERALGLALEARLARLGGPLATRADLRRHLITLALAALPPVVEDEESASHAELGELEILRRRAAKLERSLQETRSALAYVSGLAVVDEGIASIYRVVQGISREDPQLERKRDVLERIFRANLDLQKPA